MDELYTDLRQDTLLQDRLKLLLQEAETSPALTNAMDSLLKDKLRAIQQHAKSEMGLMLSMVLHLANQVTNPYNPLDHALVALSSHITAIIDTGINKINSVIKGTTDQAVKDVQWRATEPSDTRPPASIPAVTPQKTTFRGLPAQMDNPLPPNPPTQQEYQGQEDYGRTHSMRSRPSNIDDEYYIEYRQQ